jgi:O-antigen ligase
MVFTALLCVVVCLARRTPVEVPSCLGPAVLYLVLGALQLVPIPARLHAALAPGSAAYWHPTAPVAADVLGPGARPLSIDPGATRESLSFALGLFCLVVFSRLALADRSVARRVATLAVGAGFLVALYGLVARAFFGSLLFGRIAVPTVSPFGPYVSKNHFAGYVEMATLLGIGLTVGWADQARRGPRPLSWVGSPRAGLVILAAGATAVMGLAVLVSLSRGGMVSLFSGLVAFFVLRFLPGQKTSRGRVAAAAAGAALVGVTALVVLPSEGRERIAALPDVAAEASGSFRLTVWSDALRAAAASPLAGFGVGTFAAALPRYKTAAGALRVEHAENDYVELLTDAGLVGLLLGVTTLVLTVRAVARGVAAQDDRWLRGLGTGALAALASVLVHSAFDFNLRIPANAVLFALVATIALATAGPPSVRLPRWGLAFVGASLLLGLGAAVATSSSRMAALPSLRRAGADPISGLRLAAAETDLVRLLRRRPADPEAWLFLAWVRRARGDGAGGAALAAYAAGLDPTRDGLAREAARLQQPSR